ncbi:MAG: DNA topoisomerase IB [Ferruginibacter sp.]
MNNIIPEVQPLSKKKLKAISKDPEKTAAAIDLQYVHDNEPGIQRIKNGEDFTYKLNGKKLINKAVLERIKSLVIPPAWENVWICALDNGHLQATGIDIKKRKQYKYHPHWNALRNHTKYYRLLDFGNALPSIRAQLQKDISLPGLPVEKVLALVVILMEQTNIRIGNNFYEKLYGSFGLTTLKDKHVLINGSQTKFIFKGKKGVEHDISMKNRKLSALVKKCRDIPGKELFQYYDDAGNRHPIDSGMVNNYIKKISGTDFSAKDFRTWSGTLHAFKAFKELGSFETDAEKKKKIVTALDMVAGQMGNTRTVCKKYYVHPAIISLYEEKAFIKFEDKLPGNTHNDEIKTEVMPEELIILKILKTQ